MFSTPQLRMRIWQAVLVLGGALFVLAASVVLPRYVTDLGFLIAPLALFAFLAVAALFILPAHLLPAVALVAFALVPARVLPQDGPFGALPLTTAILVVWAVRRLLSGPVRPPLRARSSVARLRARPAEESAPFRAAAVVFGVLFLGWAAFTLVRSTDLQTSTGWLISFTAGALLPLAIGSAAREAEALRRAWLFLGGWLGAYALVEAALGVNFVWGTLYTVLGLTDSQHWSVYRSEASFGHPLFAGLFFAVALALAVGNWLTTSSRWMLSAAIFSGLGLVATVSRGALLAGVMAVALAYGASMVQRGEKRWSRFAALAVLAVIGLIALFQYDAFSARNNSSEAELSSQARDMGTWVAVQSANLTGWIGSGPGTSGITGRLFDDVVIENSLLQLLISVGLPGLLLFAGLVGAAFLHALSRGAVGAAAALLAYSVSISSFNAIDALRPMHLLLGCLLIVALHSGTGPERRPTPDVRRVRRPAARRARRRYART